MVEACIVQEGTTLFIEGDCILATVMSLKAMAAPFLIGIDQLTVDFSRAGRCNSACLILLLEWKRQLGERPIRLLNVPAGLVAIAEVYNLTNLLALES